MDRREFLKKSAAYIAAAGTAFLFKGFDPLFGRSNNIQSPELVAVKGSTPEKMFDAGIRAMGGIGKYVKKGQTVVIKPNIGWNKSPEYGSNTNPELVGQIVKHCYAAGAKKVYVFDHTCNYWRNTYKNSGIEKAVKKAGGVVVSGNSEKYYRSVRVPGAKILKKTKVHKLILESDVFINVPVLKHHSGALMTSAMKNLMGAVWDRRTYHYSGLHQCIADFCLYKKPDLNIVDAYTVMMKNGPRGYSKSDLKKKKMQLISSDIVAIDSAAARIFGSKPSGIPYIAYADKMNIGKMNLEKLRIKRIVM